MALEFLTCFGPDKNDARLYNPGQSSQLPNGVTFPTTTDDSVAPPQGDRWLKILSTANSILISEGDSFTGKTYGWVVMRGVRIRGTLTSGQTSQYIQIRVDTDTVITLLWVRVSDTTFKWRFTKTTGQTIVATGDTAFNTNTTYALRIQLDGTNVTLWVDGTQEIQASFTRRLNAPTLGVKEPPSSGQQHYYSRFLVCQSNDVSDRPDTDVEIGTLVEDGDWATEQGYGDDGNCNAGQTGAVAADVALSSDAVDTASYWCEHASEDDSQMVELTNYTFTGGGTIIGVAQRAGCRANVGAKTVVTQGRIHDGTNASEKSFPNLTSPSFHCRMVNHPLAPGGGAWDQTEINGFKAGVSSNTENGANDQWAGFVFEACAISNDAPVVSAFTPKVMIY